MLNISSRTPAINVSFRLLVFVASVCAGTSFALSKAPGKYYGADLILKVLDDGRNKEVVKAFGFRDSKGFKWDVPAGSRTDGASIPRALWIFGSPFTGKYLKAAVIHDHFYETKYRSWVRTHDVFYEAMLASGVPKWKAKTMWAMVYRFGSRWARGESTCWDSCAGGMLFWEDVEIIPDFIPKEAKRIREFVAKRPNASRSDIEKFMEENTFRYETGEKNEYDGSPIVEPYGARVRGYVSQSIGEASGVRPEHSYAFGGDGRRFANGEAPSWRWPSLGYRFRPYKNPTFYVTNIQVGGVLDLHEGKGATTRTIGKIPHDTHGLVLLDRCKDIWCRIRYKEIVRWVNTKYLAFDLGSE